MSEFFDLPLELIEAREQVRKSFCSVAQKELVCSIRHLGVLEPILVLDVGGKFKIVAGERRFRACEALGLKTIPAVLINEKLRNKLEKGEVTEAELQWSENEQRRGLTEIEEARVFESTEKELKLTSRELAKRYGKSEAFISERRGLLRLPESIIKLVEDGSIPFSLARLLAKAPQEALEELARQAVEKKPTSREFEKTIDKARQKSVSPKRFIGSLRVSLVKVLNKLSESAEDLPNTESLADADEHLEQAETVFSEYLKEV